MRQSFTVCATALRSSPCFLTLPRQQGPRFASVRPKRMPDKLQRERSQDSQAKERATLTIEKEFYRAFHIDPSTRQYAQQSLRSYHRAHAEDLAELRRDPVTGGADPQPKRHRAERVTKARGITSLQGTAVKHSRCYEFFTNQRRSIPGNETIEELLALGEGAGWSPKTLEHRHDYIQWLFPLREAGVNWSAPLLTSHDAARIREDAEALANVLRGFRMMLRFYGMQLIFLQDPVKSGRTAGSGSTMTAEFRRTPDTEEQQSCYGNLRRHPHNYLRISRILQFLGEVGLEKLKVAWLRFLAHEIVVQEEAERGSQDSLSVRRQSGGSTTILSEGFMRTDLDDSEDDEWSHVAKAPLGPCGHSFASFWIQTPYTKEERQSVMAETLAMLRTQGPGDGAVEDGVFVIRVSGVPVAPGTLENQALSPKN